MSSKRIKRLTACPKDAKLNKSEMMRDGGVCMKRLAARLIKLLTGIFLVSLGIVMTCQAGLGIAPWDVLHQGISSITPLTMGQVSISVGLIILAIDCMARERIGLGTIVNLVFIGAFLDMINAVNARFCLIPKAETLPMGLFLLFLSLPVTAMGLYCYMSPKLGAGPRDSLMEAIKRRVPFSVGVCRMAIEAVALTVGWLLGGSVGIGTVVLVLCSGPVMQFFFRVFHFDVAAEPNESIAETLSFIRARCTANRAEERKNA